jgi:hypothetical protein
MGCVAKVGAITGRTALFAFDMFESRIIHGPSLFAPLALPSLPCYADSANSSDDARQTN